MDKRILILGGNGFIGSHLTEALAATGARVRVLDRFGSLRADPVHGVDYRYADFVDIAAVAESLADIDLVIHLISTTVPGTANLDPVGDIEGNLTGTVRLLQQMRDAGVSRLLFLSSGGTVYGNTRTVPIPEDHRLNPLSSYGIVKVAIEHYIAMFGALFGFRPLVLRVSNPYGPRQSHLGVQGVISTFFQRILDGDPIRIWGDGAAVRDYLYVSDLVSFIVEAVRHDLTGTFNIGSGHGASVNDILTVVSEVTGTAPVVQYLPARGFDVKNVVLDIAKARNALHWVPQVSLHTGCERYWHWLNRSPR
ncbi:NAD-dependent epimerase/dehydratase family protein [uncultured Thiodictyon sp.]|uniref:NAD-dependent epimerase/dehydratase family protein n=1 Tax=uncultured Thiodictyon sp. TaxID=1846217 RepID=UPI0025FBA825|nr:NAD-dependent epimerase/dehydratase family protein [uncultured Thiodictyon sp.]